MQALRTRIVCDHRTGDLSSRATDSSAGGHRARAADRYGRRSPDEAYYTVRAAALLLMYGPRCLGTCPGHRRTSLGGAVARVQYRICEGAG